MLEVQSLNELVFAINKTYRDGIAIVRISEQYEERALQILDENKVDANYNGKGYYILTP